MMIKFSVISMRAIFEARLKLSWIYALAILNVLLVGVALGQKPSFSGSTDRHEKAEAQRHFDLGVTYQNFVGEEAKAIPEFLMAIQIRHGSYPAAWKELARSYRFGLRFAEAIGALRHFIEQTPNQDHRDELRDIRNLERAITLQGTIEGDSGVSENAYLELSAIVWGYRRFDVARDLLEKALSQYPNSVDAHLRLVEMPDISDARRLELLNRAISIAPTSAEAHSALGWYYRGGDRAIREYRLALQLSNGELASAWQGLGFALQEKGQLVEAIEALRNYLRFRKNPSSYDNYIKTMIKKLEAKLSA